MTAALCLHEASAKMNLSTSDRLHLYSHNHYRSTHWLIIVTLWPCDRMILSFTLIERMQSHRHQSRRRLSGIKAPGEQWTTCGEWSLIVDNVKCWIYAPWVLTMKEDCSYNFTWKKLITSFLWHFAPRSPIFKMLSDVYMTWLKHHYWGGRIDDTTKWDH